MKSLSSVFIGIVDVLGYSAVEQYVDRYEPDTAGALIKNIYDAVDNLANICFGTDNTITRYGDGYVLYSESSVILCLESLVKGAIKLIALSANQHIPLRLAITQGNIKISESNTSGISITGDGWDRLRELEKALNWMGGWLYLPNYDGRHHDTVTRLIQSTHLIKAQTYCPIHTFSAPFKPNSEYTKERAWFLNWHKVLHLPNDDNDKMIDAWWQNIPGWQNSGADVLSKQEATKDFAHYCNDIYRAANLIFHSGVNTELRIGEINGVE